MGTDVKLNETVSKRIHVSNRDVSARESYTVLYVNDISITLGVGRAQGYIWPTLRVCLQVIPGGARRAGRRKARLSRQCRRCSGFVFWQFLRWAVLLVCGIAFAEVRVLILICVPGKFKQVDDQFKEHSPSLCAMPDSQWDQDSRWVRLHQNRTPRNVCKFPRAWARVCFPERRVMVSITSQRRLWTDMARFSKYKYQMPRYVWISDEQWKTSLCKNDPRGVWDACTLQYDLPNPKFKLTLASCILPGTPPLKSYPK